MSIVTLKSNLNNINRHPSDVKDKGTSLNLTAGSLTVLEKLIKLSLPGLSNNFRIPLFVDPSDKLKGLPNLNLSIPLTEKKGQPINLSIPTLDKLKGLPTLKLGISIPEKKGQPVNLSIPTLDKLKGLPNLKLSIPTLDKLKGLPGLKLGIPTLDKLKGLPDLKLGIPTLDKLKGLPTINLSIPPIEKKGQPVNLSIPSTEKKGQPVNLSIPPTEKKGQPVNLSIPPTEKKGYDIPVPEFSPLVEMTSDLINGWGKPQTFDDGKGNIVSGQQTFERPSQKSLVDMESKFGPKSSDVGTRGPYGVSDVMDGTKQGRGFIPPGGSPLGFTVDMGVSEYAIGDPLNYTLTPLSHTISQMNSNLDYGVAPEQTLNITSKVEGAWGDINVPLANYVSQLSPKPDSVVDTVYDRSLAYISGISEPNEPIFKQFSRGSAGLNIFDLTSPNFDGFAFTEEIPYVIPQHTSTGPEQFTIEPFDNTPKLEHAHSTDPLSRLIDYTGLYIDSTGGIGINGSAIPSISSPGWEWTAIDEPFDYTVFRSRLYDVYQHHFLTSPFTPISLGTDLFDETGTTEPWKFGSIHIDSDDISGGNWESTYFPDSDKRRGVFDDYILGDQFSWTHVNRQASYGPYEDWLGSNGQVGSIHISPSGQLKAGLRYLLPEDEALIDIQSVIGGGVLPFADLDAFNPLGTPHESVYQNIDTGEYTVPTAFISQLLNSDLPSQRTFNIPAAYPDNTFAYSINNQFGTWWESLYFSDARNHPYLLSDNFEGITLASKFLSFHTANPDWPYKGVGLTFPGEGPDYFRLLPLSPEMREPAHAEGSLFGVRIWSWTEDLPDTFQPYIRKFVGQRYGSDTPRRPEVPIDHIGLTIDRTLEDVTRIENWMKSDAGKKWSQTQNFLQSLNPRPETRAWSKSSIINSLSPFIHDDRHSHGFGGDGRDYLHYDPLMDEPNVYGFGHFGEGGGEEGRLWRLTEELVIPEVKESGTMGFWGAVGGAIGSFIGSLWNNNLYGRAATTPSHDVKSQGGPFGETSIWIGGGEDFWDWTFWSQAELGPSQKIELKSPRKWHRTTSYRALGKQVAYSNRIGGGISNMVYNWGYLDPDGFDVLDDDVYGEDRLDSIFYPGDGNRPDDGIISFTTGDSWFGGNWETFLNEETTHPIWSGPGGVSLGAPQTSPKYVTLAYKYLGSQNAYVNRQGFGSNILQNSWRYFDPSNKNGHKWWSTFSPGPQPIINAEAVGESEPWSPLVPVETVIENQLGILDNMTRLLSQLQVRIDQDIHTQKSLNNVEDIHKKLRDDNIIFTIGKSAHHSRIYRLQDSPFYTEDDHFSYSLEDGAVMDWDNDKIIPKHSIITIPNENWSWSGAVGKAPRSSDETNYFVKPYLGLDYGNAYAPNSSPAWIKNMENIGQLEFFAEAASPMVRFSWRFLDSANADEKLPYWTGATGDKKTVFQQQVESLQDRIFTIGKDSHASDIPTALEAGVFPTSPGHTASIVKNRLWMSGTPGKAPLTSKGINYYVSPFSELGKPKYVAESEFWNSAAGAFSPLVQYSWRFMDAGHTGVDKTVNADMFVGTLDEKQIGSFQSAVSELKKNVFTIGDDSHKGGDGSNRDAFWTKVVTNADDMEMNPDWNPIIGYTKSANWAWGSIGTAPRDQDSIKFITKPYSALNKDNAYASAGKTTWTSYRAADGGDGKLDWANFGGISSPLVRFSWRFMDSSHVDAKAPYWEAMDDEKGIFAEQVTDLKTKVFTINETQAAKNLGPSGLPAGDLIKRYQTLSYGHLNKNFGYFNRGMNLDPDQTLDHLESADIDKDTGDFTGIGSLTAIQPLSPGERQSLEKLTAGSKQALLNMVKPRKEGMKITDGIGNQGKGAYYKYGDDEKLTKENGRVTDTLVKGTPGTPVGGIIKKGNLNKYKSEFTDKINMLPYGQDYTDPEDGAVDDFIKFKFYDRYNKKFIIFRALLSGISDSITPEWSGTRYIGRPDQVWVYSGTERAIGFTFDVYPKTRQEFPVLLEKVNYLIGLCYPSFTSDNRMVAPFIDLTIGDMFNETPGFLNSLSVDVDDVSTWEIDEGLQFPKKISCACEFTYIGKYLPSSLGKHYELPWLRDHGWSGNFGVGGNTKGTFESGNNDAPTRITPTGGTIGDLSGMFSDLGSTNTQPTVPK